MKSICVSNVSMNFSQVKRFLEAYLCVWKDDFSNSTEEPLASVVEHEPDRGVRVCIFVCVGGDWTTKQEWQMFLEQ